MEPTALAFTEYSRTLLAAELFPRIESCVRQLSEDDLWWRPNESSNSIGNLVLHLSGNVRQWIVSGIGGAEDDRRRQEEFDERGPIPADQLLQRLSLVIADASEVLANVGEGELLRERQIQGSGVTGLQAIYHVVEHFSMHVGQIVYITKLRLGRDLGFYRMVDGIPRPQWPNP